MNDYQANAEQAVADGEATRFNVGDGYLVLQKWGKELFVLFIKWPANTLHFPAMLDTLKNLALSEGCDTIAGIGRRGWRRALAKYGFREAGDGQIELKLTRN